MGKVWHGRKWWGSGKSAARRLLGGGREAGRFGTAGEEIDGVCSLGGKCLPPMPENTHLTVPTKTCSPQTKMPKQNITTTTLPTMGEVPARAGPAKKDRHTGSRRV